MGQAIEQSFVADLLIVMQDNSSMQSPWDGMRLTKLTELNGTFNTCRAEFIFLNMYAQHFLSIKMAQVVEILPLKDKDLLIL